MDVHKSSLLAVFDSKQRLEVPLFQRQYVWNEEQHWLPLWEDIQRKFIDALEGRKDAPNHFLGAMVLDQKQTPTGHVVLRQIIDGQQRLTTLQIFLAAYRDFCKEQATEPLANECDKFLFNTSGKVCHSVLVLQNQARRGEYCHSCDRAARGLLSLQRRTFQVGQAASLFRPGLCRRCRTRPRLRLFRGCSALGGGLGFRRRGFLNRQGIHAGDRALGEFLLGGRHLAGRLTIEIDARAAAGEGDLIRPSLTVAAEHEIALFAEQDAARDKIAMDAELQWPMRLPTARR